MKQGCVLLTDQNSYGKFKFVCRHCFFLLGAQASERRRVLFRMLFVACPLPSGIHATPPLRGMSQPCFIKTRLVNQSVLSWVRKGTLVLCCIQAIELAPTG